MAAALRRLAAFAVVTLACAATSTAQPATRRAADIASLVEYAGFYHGQPVVLHAELVETGSTMALVHPDEPRAIHVTAAPGAAVARAGRVEARGVFWDVGRLTRDDPQVVGNDLLQVVGMTETAAGEWPKPGEVFALRLTDAFAITAAAEPSLRDLVLDPQAYRETQVTVTGQFRGRNLYGDLPQAPGLSRWDFVLKTADAALWVTGTRARGRGFDLNVGSRADTGRWLEVSGTLKHAKGLVWLESVTIATSRAPTNLPPPETTARPMGPAPVVVFSAPTQDETGVALSTGVRLQFSRDMDATSFADQVRVDYAASDTAEPGATTARAPAFTSVYDPATRALSIRMAEPFPAAGRFRTIVVELRDGIKARDGAAMTPWKLLFQLGGS